MVTANVTSLAFCFEQAVHLPGDILGLREVRMDAADQERYTAILHRRGWTPLWANPLPTAAWRMTPPYATKGQVWCGRVGWLCSPGPLTRPNSYPYDTPRRQRLWDTSRWLHAIVAIGIGRQVCIVHVVYGVSGADHDPHARGSSSNPYSKRQLL